MSFLDRAKKLAKNATDVAIDVSASAAQSAMNGAEMVRDRATDVVDDFNESRELKKIESLPDVIEYLLSNKDARLFVADALSSALEEANDDTSWDEIIKAAMADLSSTPAGSK